MSFQSWGASWGQSWGDSWGQTIQPEVLRFGGSLGWYHGGWPKKVEEFKEEYIEALESVSAEIDIADKRPEYTKQKKIIAQNVLRQIDALEIFNSPQIQQAIADAEFLYYKRLEAAREAEDEAALLLLLN